MDSTNPAANRFQVGDKIYKNGSCWHGEVTAQHDEYYYAVEVVNPHNGQKATYPSVAHFEITRRS